MVLHPASSTETPILISNPLVLLSLTQYCRIPTCHALPTASLHLITIVICHIAYSTFRRWKVEHFVTLAQNRPAMRVLAFDARTSTVM
jgi:hypothetical protein